MIGGRDFALSQFNRATQSLRQVGSSFKIYDYTAGFEAGMKPYEAISDAATTFYTASGPYTPHDYEAGFAGTMTMIDAFAQSRNIPALRIADKVGIKKVIEVARRFGVTSPMPNFLPVAIGAADLTLSEQVTDHAALHPARDPGGWSADRRACFGCAGGHLGRDRPQDDAAAAGGHHARDSGCRI